MASGDSEGRIRHSRSSLVITDIFSQIVREYIAQSGINPLTLYRTIVSTQDFYRSLTQDEINVVNTLQNAQQGSEYDKFDISLMYKLIRCPYFALLIPYKPTGGWGSIPQPGQTTVGDDIERIRIERTEQIEYCREIRKFCLKIK